MTAQEEARVVRAPPAPDEEREIDFGRLGRTILKRWWIVLAAVVLGALAGYLTSVGGGDVFVARTRKKGLIRRITQSSLARTKLPTFSPDGKWIVGSEEAPLHGKSACSYSGLNDNFVLGNGVPDADGFTRTQSWGQVIRNAGPLGGAAFGCNPNRAEGE